MVIFVNKSKVFLIFSLAFILGIALPSFIYPYLIDPYYLWLTLILNLIIFFAFYKNKLALIACFLMIFFLSGLYFTNQKLVNIKNLKETTVFEGEALVVKEPVMKEKYQQLIILPLETTTDLSQGTRILLNVSFYPQYQYGDRLKINCRLKIPQNIENFDYRMYLAKDGIYYICQSPQIEKVGEGEGNKIYSFILAVKNKVKSNIQKIIPSPESGLLLGLLIGGSDLLPKDVQASFSRTGMSHIVAVSGYNVTIVAEYLMFLGIAIGLWRRQAFWFAVGGIVLFVFVTGFPASAVRAGVMGTLLLWAMKNGRLANAQNAIIFSAVIMLLFNPLLLRWDVGFQLSFLATLGIVYLYPALENRFINPLVETSNSGVSIFIIKPILEILFLSLAAQVFVLPIIFYNFKMLSLISPLANILVLPIIPFTMLMGFFMIIISFIFFPLVLVFSWLTYLPLKYETLIINYLSSLKYAVVEISLPWWGVAGWYAILVWWMYFLRKKQLKII